MEARTMRNCWTSLVAAGILAMAVPVCAGDKDKNEDVNRHPGFVDFAALNVFGDEGPEVEVFLDRGLIAMVGSMSKRKDPAFAEMLNKLLQIRVQTFAIPNDKLSAIEAKTEEMARKLEGKGWQTLVRVNDKKDRSQTYVYIKPRGGVFDGLVVMNVDPKDDASFVNIVGEIDPEKLGELGSKFDINELDSLGTQIRMHHGRDDDRKDKKKE
jgi:hypothetical protein